MRTQLPECTAQLAGFSRPRGPAGLQLSIALASSPPSLAKSLARRRTVLKAKSGSPGFAGTRPSPSSCRRGGGFRGVPGPCSARVGLAPPSAQAPLTAGNEDSRGEARRRQGARSGGAPERGRGRRRSRPPGQRWVWMNFESPSHSPGLRGLAADLFNWTLSYRADSDVFVPYGFLRPRGHPSDQPPGLGPPLARKRGLVAWVVSHWDERQARVRYYHQLSRHVPVDVFGRNGPGRPVPASGLLHTVARYKFYLAFENSQHVDYITEKLWRNAFLAGAVPVVLGPDRANYERFVPRGAFIHVDDFPSAAALAAYLRFLDRNVAVYRRYFHWRRSYAVHLTSFWDEPWCRACQAVQTAGDQPKSIRNLAGWFER
ncbi:alpha-(1,3)-fucosyltransferase 4 [Nannospalax galili]|uniref:alpha-(1,3)-fucosyltransferase 4 n=1 Tax=Nannospalax galili TaxID=1026970 RepID=UPI00111BF545|nr:alpha-(1,3)-fucosyltransferase 4 [Nannospalax galili]